MFLMYFANVFFFYVFRRSKKINTLAKNIKNIKRLEHQKISTSKLVTELSFHSFCKIQTDSKCYESAQYISRKKNFLLRARMQCTEHACEHIIIYMRHIIICLRIIMFVRKTRENFKHLVLRLCCMMTMR